MRIGNAERLTQGCDFAWLGIDESQCATSDVIDASNVHRDNAPMLRIALESKVDLLDFVNVGSICGLWTVQIAEGPCAGWYLDQNYNLEALINQREFVTQWRRERSMFALVFDNESVNLDQVNAFNLDPVNLGNFMKYYSPYWEQGRFQIPRHFQQRDSLWEPVPNEAFNPD